VAKGAAHSRLPPLLVRIAGDNNQQRFMATMDAVDTVVSRQAQGAWTMDNLNESAPLKIAVCEDVKSEQKRLVELIEETRIEAEVTCFKNGESFLAQFSEGAYDLIFLDIYMAELSGIQVAEQIRAQDTQAVIVFTTTSEDFTREGYRLNAYKYMLKPVAPDDILDSLELARVKRDRAQGATIRIMSDGEAVALPLADIVLIEASNRRSVFHMADDATWATTTTIDALEKLLPSPRFLRSHRAFIVNLDHVSDVDEDFQMDNGMCAYIRVKDFRNIKRAYDEYLFNSVRSSW
jgi:DNA-binding LytR/AlgR family response regulator